MRLPSLLATTSHPPAIETAEQWRAHWCAQQLGGETPFDMAVRGGFEADRLSWAFGGGYQAALAAAMPQVPRDAVGSLCATEAEGNRPRHIHSRLFTNEAGQLRLTGHKRWSLAPAATRLWVLVRDERHTAPQAAPAGEARIAFKLVRVASTAPGVRITAMPPTSFMPDLQHSELHFDGVAVDEADILPGDGYSDFVKPFRTLEDIHVTAACLAHLLRQIRLNDWPPSLAEDALALLHALQGLAQEAASAPPTHLALAGVLRGVDRFHAALDAHAATVPDSLPALRWQRDRKLFGLSAKIREARTQRARENLGASGASAKAAILGK